MELRKGYKQTEVGVIPDDWEINKLSEITTLMTNGFVGTATTFYSESDSDILYIQGYNVEENGFNFRGIKYVTKDFHKQHFKSSLQEGDLLTIQTGDVGLTTIVPKELVGSNCHALIISRLKKENFNSKYYSYYFNSFVGRSRLKIIETGTTMKHINVGDLLQFVVPIPPTKTEQTAIANALSDADALISSLEKLIEKKRNIKQGAMQELLKPKKGWVTKKLGEIGKCYRGVSYNPERDLHSYDKNITMRLLRSNNIQNQSLDYHGLQFVDKERVKANQILMENDIVICMANGSKQLVGKSAIYNNGDNLEYTFGAFMGCFRIDEAIASSIYIALNFQSYQYRNYIDILLSGSSINNLNPGNIESIEIPFPPLEEQTHIATIVFDMDKEIISLETKLIKAKQIKQGMMQELLTGKIRLV